LLLDEASTLRADFLTWAVPLVRAQKLDQAALDRIKEGSGYKDTAADLMALAPLFRSNWTEIRSICGITQAQLDRAAVLGPGLFAMISRRENKIQPSYTDGSLRVRRFWTLADRAYSQCQRAIAFFEWEISDLNVIAPNLRPGSRGRSTAATPDPSAPTPTPATPAAPSAPAAATPTSPIVPAVAVGPQGPDNGPFARR
jgi:hypothetical protein